MAVIPGRKDRERARFTHGQPYEENIHTDPNMSESKKPPKMPTEHNWKEIEKHMKSEWNRLTEDDLENIREDHEELIERLQEKHNMHLYEALEAANKFWDEMEKRNESEEGIRRHYP